MDGRYEPVPVTRLPDDIPMVEMPREMLDKRLIVGFDGFDARSRAFNLLRTQLTKILDAKKWNMIGVTSATPGAGKTFTSVNLAAALSRTEKRKVLLCDLDMRRGSVLKQLGVGANVTLDDCLRGECEDWRDALFKVNNDHFLVLPTEAELYDPTEIITGDRFNSLMRDLRGLGPEYLVVCDLPPVFANDDAMLCMAHLDAYLYIVDHGHTTARQIEESLALLAPAQCLGTVLNRYQGGLGDDYGYGYGDTYGLREYSAKE